VALGWAYPFPPLSSRGALISGSTAAPFPHPAHRTGRADRPHPALGQDLTPSSTDGIKPLRPPPYGEMCISHVQALLLVREAPIPTLLGRRIPWLRMFRVIGLGGDAWGIQ
jgi:hypothetical protein